jgi:hypothetical protein
MCENKVLRRISGSKRKEMRRGCTKSHNGEQKLSEGNKILCNTVVLNPISGIIFGYSYMGQ